MASMAMPVQTQAMKSRMLSGPMRSGMVMRKATLAVSLAKNPSWPFCNSAWSVRSKAAKQRWTAGLRGPASEELAVEWEVSGAKERAGALAAPAGVMADNLGTPLKY